VAGTVSPAICLRYCFIIACITYTDSTSRCLERGPQERARSGVRSILGEYYLMQAAFGCHTCCPFDVVALLDLLVHCHIHLLIWLIHPHGLWHNVVCARPPARLPDARWCNYALRRCRASAQRLRAHPKSPKGDSSTGEHFFGTRQPKISRHAAERGSAPRTRHEQWSLMRAKQKQSAEHQPTRQNTPTHQHTNTTTCPSSVLSLSPCKSKQSRNQKCENKPSHLAVSSKVL
jgi:hypothetical protein